MISTHILDTSQGIPAGGVPVRLEEKVGEVWKSLSSGKTNSDGRFSFDCEKKTGLYQIIFEVEHYGKSFFPSVTVQFRIEDLQRKYHVPLLLSPYGYSTYRGS